MKLGTFLKTAILTSAITCTAAASAQKINPNNGVNWPLATGSGAPAASCTSANYEQPYLDTSTTPNTQYQCGSSGWFAAAAPSAITALHGDGAATGPGSALFTLTTVNSGAGACGDSTHFCVPTTNGKGLVTSQTAVALPTLGTMATQNANSVAITGGAINGTTVGQTTAAAGKFTTLSSTSTTTLAAGTTIGGSAVCLSGGTNCPASFGNPMTAAGDFIVGGTAGAATRLAGATAAGPNILFENPSTGAFWDTTTNLFSAPPPIGTTTPGIGAFATLTVVGGTPNSFSIDGNGNVSTGGTITGATSTAVIFGGTSSVSVTALSTATTLAGTGSASGMLVLRDNTLGGSAMFILDANLGSQLLGTSQITGLGSGSVTWNGTNWTVSLSSGSVPRTLTWCVYAT
jgi:hypothetical protein